VLRIVTDMITVVSFPVAYFFHIYPWRRGPLIVGVITLEVGLVVFMLVTPFWAMVIARSVLPISGTI
jgi:DHA1 family vesicular acetylcholine transporter-like MFS transporter 3